MKRYYLVPSSTTAASGESPALDVLAQLMGGSSNSYLYRALVVDRPLAVNASASYQGASLDPSQFVIAAAPQPGVEFAQIEEAFDKVIPTSRSTPAAEDLERVKTQLIAEAIYAQDNQATLARWYGGASPRAQHRRHQELAGPHSRRHRRTGARCCGEMAGQEAVGDRLSDQGYCAETRGEALVSYSITRRAALIGGAAPRC